MKHLHNYLNDFTEQAQALGVTCPFSLLGKFEESFIAPEIGDKLDEYYRKTVIPHKLAVLESGLELMQVLPALYQRPLSLSRDFVHRLLGHDLSKFSDNEQWYADYRFKGENTESAEELFKFAWFHHKKHNDHHPEYWYSVSRDGKEVIPMEMPYICLAEMVADWMGAGKTYGTDFKEWVPKNINSFLFHPRSWMFLKEILTYQGIEVEG